MKVTSRYKWLKGLLPIIFMNLLSAFVGLMVGAIFIGSILTNTFWEGKVLFPLYIIVFYMECILIKLLMFDCRRIIIQSDCIILINPMLPFLKKRIYWYELDEMKMAVELGMHGKRFAAIWLLKNRKLKCRISSFYYSNFSELKVNIPVHSTERIRVGAFETLLCSMGKKVY